MMDEKLRPFQRRFVKAVESSSYDTVALSAPRGLGNTFLAGHVLARALTPGDKLNQPGAEYVLEVWPESHWPGFALRQADVLQSYTA